MVFWGGQLAFSPGVRNRFSRSGNVLVLGIDPIGANADVVVAVQLQGGQMQITQIPRDTFTNSEALGSWKIGELYGLAGAEAIQEQVTALVDADFPYLVVVHEGVVAALVDALGGLTVTVPTRMVYSDRSQGLFIDLQPGRQQLNGQQVEQLIRWRDFHGDIGRLERRQEVINALNNAFQDTKIWGRLPMLTKVLEDEAKAGRLATNLDLQALPSIARGFVNRGATIEILPGQEGYYKGLSYWFADQGALPPHGSTSSPQQNASPPEAAPLPQQDPFPPRATLPPLQHASPPRATTSPQESTAPLIITPPPSISPFMEQDDDQTGDS